MIQPLNRRGMDAWTEQQTTVARTREAASAQGDGGEQFTVAAESPTSSLANKQTFLTLLVAQIKNQNPLNPADGTEFLSQLAQFSELEQLISIREEVQALHQAGWSSARTDS